MPHSEHREYEERETEAKDRDFVARVGTLVLGDGENPDKDD
jgi:hypothetical protein